MVKRVRSLTEHLQQREEEYALRESHIQKLTLQDEAENTIMKERISSMASEIHDLREKQTRLENVEREKLEHAKVGFLFL